LNIRLEGGRPRPPNVRGQSRHAVARYRSRVAPLLNLNAQQPTRNIQYPRNPMNTGSSLLDIGYSIALSRLNEHHSFVPSVPFVADSSDFCIQRAGDRRNSPAPSAPPREKCLLQECAPHSGAATLPGRPGPILRRSGFEGQAGRAPRGLRRRSAHRILRVCVFLDAAWNIGRADA